MSHSTDFTNTVVDGDVEITTHFRRGRRGARPDKRVIKKATAVRASGEGGSAAQDIPTEPAWPEPGISGILGIDQDTESLALRLLNDIRVKDVRRTAEYPFRARLAKVGIGDAHSVLHSLVSSGLIEREERLDPLGNPTASYFTLTDFAASVLGSMFGPNPGDPIEHLVGFLERMLASCIRPEIKAFFNKQMERARSGGPVFLETTDEEPIVYTSPGATPSYLKILQFFGYVGSCEPRKPLDFKEVAGFVNHGERDSVKMLENLRATIAEVAETEVGVSLDDMGIQGAHLLYWIPFCGDLRPEGHAMWGAFPALSTKDLRSVRFCETSARVIALVENRAVLEHLSDLCGDDNGWLMICTEGNPKLALYDLLARIDDASDRTYLVWTDWDVGGLRISEKLLEHLNGRVGPAILVPHPAMPGRGVEVPEVFLKHRDTAVRRMAADIARYGAVYQEEAFSRYPPEALERLVQSRGD